MRRERHSERAKQIAEMKLAHAMVSVDKLDNNKVEGNTSSDYDLEGAIIRKMATEEIQDVSEKEEMEAVAGENLTMVDEGLQNKNEDGDAVQEEQIEEETQSAKKEEWNICIGCRRIWCDYVIFVIFILFVCAMTELGKNLYGTHEQIYINSSTDLCLNC